jgi:hypothetical protein
MTPKPRRTKSRFASKPLTGRPASLPPFDHPALTEARTLYPTTVREPSRNAADQWALKSGENSSKIGGLVLKGRWHGFPIYTLTLEERATCPRTCHHWRSCFGNGTHLADRIAAGSNLEWRLAREVGLLDIDHPRGFCIRAHVLGDFYSVGYVALWRTLLERHPALHVFGFTARHDKSDAIAAALIALTRDYPDHFCMRFSNAPQPFEAASTVSIEHPFQKPKDAVICPEQTGRTESCSTCGLCWATSKRVAFLQH